MDAKNKHTCAEPRYFMDTAVVETDDGPPQPRQAAFLMCTQEGCHFHLGDCGEIVAYIRALESRAAELEKDLLEVATSGVEFEDERIHYVAVQIDRDLWVKLRAALRSADKKGRT